MKSSLSSQAIQPLSVILLSILVLLLVAVRSAEAGSLDTWTKRYTGDKPFNAVVFGNGKFVAVGNNGRVATSPDGVTWTKQSGIPLFREGDRDTGIPLNDNKSNLYGVTYGGGLFVAVGDGYDNEALTNFSVHNGIYTSPDGVVWTLVSHTFPDGSKGTFSSLQMYNLFGVTYGSGKFIAVGNGSALVSTNGSNWTEVNTNTSQLNGVGFGNGLFVAAGNGNYFITSPDGLTWTPRYSGSSDTTEGFQSVAYGNGRFVVVGSNGSYSASMDGATWQYRHRDDNYSMKGVAYGSGVFAIPADLGIISTTSDGITLADRQISGVGDSMQAICFGLGTFVTIGPYGDIYQSGVLQPMLSITVNGTGSGSVNSNPVGISCMSGSNTDCYVPFIGGSLVDLFPAPSKGSILSSWSYCGGYENCKVFMDGDQNVTATFDITPPVHITGGVDPAYYNSVQTAYDAAVDQGEVQIQQVALVGNLDAGRPINVKIGGGYDASFTSRGGESTIHGNVTLSSGTVVMDSVILK